MCDLQHPQQNYVLFGRCGYSCASARRPTGTENTSSLNHSSLFPWCARPAWSGGTVCQFLSIHLLTLLWGATWSNCLAHQMSVPPPLCGSKGWAWEKVLPCSWCCLHTAQISCDLCQCDKKPFPGSAAALDVGMLLEMNKCFTRSLPLSHAGIREVSRLVSHLGLLLFAILLSCKKIRFKLLQAQHLLLQLWCKGLIIERIYLCKNWKIK